MDPKSNIFNPIKYSTRWQLHYAFSLYPSHQLFFAYPSILVSILACQYFQIVHWEIYSAHSSQEIIFYNAMALFLNKTFMTFPSGTYISIAMQPSHSGLFLTSLCPCNLRYFRGGNSTISKADIKLKRLANGLKQALSYRGKKTTLEVSFVKFHLGYSLQCSILEFHYFFIYL